jgi:hypothetical protein
LGAGAKHDCFVPQRSGCLRAQSLKARGGLERTTIPAGSQTNLRACPQKAKCHRRFDAANGREILGSAATIPEMFRKPE